MDDIVNGVTRYVNDIYGAPNHGRITMTPREALALLEARAAIIQQIDGRKTTAAQLMAAIEVLRTFVPTDPVALNDPIETDILSR
jgi:hypothetical protein